MEVHYRGISLLVVVVAQALCFPVPQSQGGKSEQSPLSPYDPQILNYQLQQLALQQYSRAQDQNQQTHELALQEYTRAQDYTRAQEQSQQSQQLALQQYAAIQGQQGQTYNSQGAQYPTLPTQAVQFPTLPTQAQQIATTQSNNEQFLQQKLFQPAYQTQFTTGPLVGQTEQAGQTGQAQQQQLQQSDKQKLLGVAYSSAADASRTSFSGYGIKYSF